MEKQRSYNLPEWKTLTHETQHQPPAKRGERRRNQKEVVRGAASTRNRDKLAEPTSAAESDSAPQEKRKPGRPARKQAPAKREADNEETATGRRSGRNKAPPTPDSPTTQPAKPGKKPGRPAKGGQAKSVTSRRLNNTAEAADYIDEAAFEDFDYGMEDLDEYTPERCAELENHYWRSLGFNQPMYAADMPGSLFDDSVTSWNVAHLENLLDVLGTKVPGVNTAYLYMGMWKATFAWHLEDVDLYSINYIHFGAPKQWYSISQEDARKFEKAMKQIWPVDSKNCDQFLRHKTYLISPDVLQKQYGVKVNKLVHYEGEFVITFPYGYHSGYNIGYNCAESVNFATESWLEYGKLAKKCNCETDNVWVDVNEIERKMRGEPTPEYYEETDDESEVDEDDGMLTPPASVKGKSASKKRKRPVKAELPKKKKKIRIKVRPPKFEPCVMCPNDNHWEDLLPTDHGKKAHRICAKFTPETYIDKDETTGVEKVIGFTSIERGRLDLKCNFCRSKRGSCFQCSGKKCTRAFHATCALAAGVQIDEGMVPTFGEDGTEYYELGYDFRCKYHRPKMPKNATAETLEGSKRVRDYARELKPNDGVQAQLIGGEVFGALVVENRAQEMSLLVDVLPEGYVYVHLDSLRARADLNPSDRIELEYKHLCLFDPELSLRIKPSSNAVPMPEGMSRKALSMNNRQDGVPSQDDTFNDNPEYKWHDFYNNDTPPPGYARVKLQQPLKLKVDFDRSDALFYYLPQVSTEAKVFFTDKPGSNEVCARANFLDRVQPPKPVYQYQASAQKHAQGYSTTPNTMFKRQLAPNPGGNSAFIHKPYTYKPKDPMRPNAPHMGNYVDRQALANQRGFVTDSSACRQAIAPLQPKPSQQGQKGPNGQPLRSFPPDQYYSMKTLPAAYPGEHSTFREAARRESHGSQSLPPYTPVYQSVREQQAARKSNNQFSAPVAPMMGTPSAQGPAPNLPPNPSASNGSRPSSSSHSYQSPYGAPLTPATTHSVASKGTADAPSTDREYIKNLEKYPYLLQSYCRKPKVYQSPYPLSGGFSSEYQNGSPSQQRPETARHSHHTPQNSVDRRLSESQWTPPSQIWAQHGHFAAQTPPPQRVPQYIPAQRPQAVHQSPQDFQRQISGGSLPSTASRDGAQARLLRDQGYSSYTPHTHPYHRNSSFGSASAHPQSQMQGPSHGHGYGGGGNGPDVAKMYLPGGAVSPKAPTPSPVSDPNTPARNWGAIPPQHQQQQQQQQAYQAGSGAGGGYAPMVPQMGGGNETWRYAQ